MVSIPAVFNSEQGIMKPAELCCIALSLVNKGSHVSKGQPAGCVSATLLSL